MTSRFVCIVIFILSCSHFAAAYDIEIKHYQSHGRYEFGIKLLNLAMEKTTLNYKVTPAKIDMNEARGEQMVIHGDLDLEFMSTNEDREKKMIPVKFPVYRGLLGLRLLLIEKTNNDLNNKKHWELSELRKYTAGHGRFWGDLPVYAANNLPVITNPFYDGIFRQLIRGRIDYFHRGVAEIWEELEQYNTKLVIAETIMLFYKHPVYYFVTKTRPDLAKLLEKGLNIAIKDGSYKKLFLEYYGNKIKNSSLENRELVILENPVVPADCPPLDTSWWAPEKYQRQLSY